MQLKREQISCTTASATTNLHFFWYLLTISTKAWRSSSTAKTGESCSMALRLFGQRQETRTLTSGSKHLPGCKELMIAEPNMEQTCSVPDHDQQMSSKNISLCHTATDTMNRNRSKHTAVPSYLPKRWNRGEISRMKACKDNGTC